MKKIILIAAVTFLASVGFSQKYGHLNAQEVLKELPEYIAAQKEMESYGQQKEKELMTLQQNFQEQYAKYEKDAATLTPEIRKSRENDLMDLQQNIQKFQQSAQEKIQKKEIELLDPMIKKVKDAIQTVGKANGYTYIFDTSAGSILYFDGGKDVSELVKKELTK